MNIKLDLQSGIPITRQVVEQIQYQIASGILKPGDQLPTVRALASELGVNFNTIARCYRRLDNLGLISTQQGRGTYVIPRAPGLVGQARQVSLDALSDRYLGDAQRLGYSKSQALSNLRKRADG